MAKWIKNVSGESRNVIGVPVADGAFYQIPASKEIAASENEDIINWVGAADMKMSEDGSTTIDSTSDGLQYLFGRVELRDSDGAIMERVKMFKTGVAVRFHFFSFKTSDYANGVHHKKCDGTTNFGYFTYKIYDSNGDEITDAANNGDAVKTVLDWEPSSIDYEIVGGKFYQAAAPTTNVYVHVVGVPDLTEAQGGSVPFCSDANLKLMGDGLAFETDGRVPKTMTYDATYHTSKLRIILYHDTGVQHECMGEFQIAH